MADNKSIGGLWKNNKNGKNFLSGSIEINGEKHKFVAFENGYKEEGDNKPDYNILLSTGGQTQNRNDDF